MGYTHYWGFVKPRRSKGATDRADRIYKDALLECQQIAKVYQNTAYGLNRLSGHSVHAADGKYGGLAINGKLEMGHEDFTMREHFRDALKDSDFCKTAHKPYDIVVVACLCLLKFRMQDLMRVESDGDSEEWILGARLASRVLSEDIPVPASIKPAVKKAGVVTLTLIIGGKK